MSPEAVLAGIAFVAAIANGALGYGFSSIVVPVALLFFSNKALNPALVAVELAVNAYVLFLARKSLGAVWKRSRAILIGVPLGVLAGSLLLSSSGTGQLRLATYAVLLPLILLQAAGWRRPLPGLEGAFGLPFGAAVGTLYSATTISGPPLALALNNQGYAKDEFKASMALVRTTEAALAALAYGRLGLFTPQTADILRWVVPSAAVGIPIGAFLIRRLDSELFRRLCMSFDAWLVAFGLSRLLGLWPLLAAVAVLDAGLLYSFLRSRREKALTGKANHPILYAP